MESPTSKHSSSSDVELMLTFRAGDSTAFDALFDRYRQRIYNYLLRGLGERSAAEDLLQATFVRLIEARSRYEPKAAFSTWIYTIATNLARDHARRAAVETGSRPSVPSHTEMSKGSGASRAHLRESLERAVASLPEREKEAFLLGKYEGRSYEEIAEILGCSVGAVKVRIHRAMKRLRSALGEWIE